VQLMESWNILECLGIVTAKFLGWDEAWGLHGWHVVPFQVFPEEAPPNNMRILYNSHFFLPPLNFVLVNQLKKGFQFTFNLLSFFFHSKKLVLTIEYHPNNYIIE
jgi:hypothetical protein